MIRDILPLTCKTTVAISSHPNSTMKMSLPKLFATVACICFVGCVLSASNVRASPISLDGVARTLEYDGHGALSAGASSRLLIDYSEPYRSQILDYLFLPNFGANLHLIKVEIGGDAQSTDGAEASHWHSLNPPMHSCAEGYEFWLLQEARRRNPKIVTYALSWGAPGWVGNGTYYSSQGIDYHIDFMNCVRDVYGIHLDYMGIWNERPWGTTKWVKQYRAAMDEAGYTGTQIVIPDGWLRSQLTDALVHDDEFRQAVSVVGLHYPCNHPAPEIIDMGLKFWSSEDYSTVGNWAGAGCWGRLFNQNYLRMNMTSTISWSLIWSVYPGLPYFGNGLMYAYEPWSGYYTVNYPIWTSAQTCQFSEPGWVYLAQGDPTKQTSAMGSGYLAGGGSFITLVPPTSDPSSTLGKNTVAMAGGGDFSLIIEKLEGDCLRCKGQNTINETVEFVLSGGLGGYPDGSVKISSLRLFCTNSTVGFQQHADVLVNTTDGSFRVDMYKDSICSVSTTVGAHHGVHPGPPASQPFPYSYSTSFDDYNNISQQALYFTDQGGSFIIQDESGDKVLQQVVVEPPGHNQWSGNPLPTTMIGSEDWNNVHGQVMLRLDEPQWPAYNNTLMAGLCLNVPTSRWIRGGKSTPEGVCVLVTRPVGSENGVWMVVVQSLSRGRTVLHQSPLSEAKSWVSITLMANATSYEASVNSDTATNNTCTECAAHAAGYAALTSGWNMAVFDNFSAKASPPPVPPHGSWVQSLKIANAARRNNFNGPVGAAVQPVNGPVHVSALGRYYGNGNGNGNHTLALLEVSGGRTIAECTVSGTSSPDTLGFVYSDLPNKVTLLQGEKYYFTSTEVEKGDYFLGSGNNNPYATTTANLELLSSVYYFEKTWHEIDTVGTMYGPLNMILE